MFQNCPKTKAQRPYYVVTAGKSRLDSYSGGLGKIIAITMSDCVFFRRGTVGNLSILLADQIFKLCGNASYSSVQESMQYENHIHIDSQRH